MVDGGAQLRTFPVADWFDCGTQEALLATNQALLAGSEPLHVPDGIVVVPPVHIDPTAQVVDAIIGPHVSIGAGARVHRSDVSNSIVGEQATVEGIVIKDSLVGFQAVVKGLAYHLNVGDQSEITS